MRYRSVNNKINKSVVFLADAALKSNSTYSICCGLVVDLLYNISTCCGFVVDLLWTCCTTFRLVVDFILKL